MRTGSAAYLAGRGNVSPRATSIGERSASHTGEQREIGITNELLASAAVLALIWIALLGPVGVLFFIGATGLLLLQNPARNLMHLVRFSPMLLLPLLAMVSVEWSDAPATSMRAGLQLLITFVAAIIAARNMRIERMIAVLFFGYGVICLTILPNIPASLSTGHALTNAALGSKNQVSFAGYMLVTLALAIVFDGLQHWALRLLAIATIPYGLVLVYLAQSGGGTSSLLIAIIAIPAFASLRWLNPGARVAVLVFGLGAIAIAVAFMPEIEAAVSNFRTEKLQKDATLTGRTYLWQFADRLSTEHPWFGIGYNAFWRQGNIDAEGLYRWAGITNRSGFNFHNAFVSMRLELGLVGEWLLIATCVAVAIVALTRQFIRPSTAMACLLAMLAVAYARSYVEDGLIASFSPTTVVWVATFVYAFATRGGIVRTGLFVQHVRRVD